MQDLEGRVAVVTGGGDELGRAVALLLASRGSRVVVTGPDERALGETVGEIAYGGGKARHVAGDVAGAIARAVEVFGRLDAIVHADTRADAAAAFDAARKVAPDVVAVDGGSDGPERIVSLVASAFAAR